MGKTLSDDGSSVRQASKTLSAERREKLLALRDRERMNDVLLQKFERRYGPGRVRKDDDTQSVSESVLRKEVNTFVNKAALTEDNLGRLERRMRQHARKKAHNDEAASIISAYSQVSKQSAEDQSQYRMQPLEGIPEETTYDWGKLDEYAKLLHQRDEFKLRLGVVEQQKKQREALDKQIQDARERKKIQQDSDQRFHDNQMAELTKWKADEQVKEAEIRNKALTEKKGRDIQLQYERQLRGAEAERKKQDDELLLSQIANKTITEKENAIKKKARDRELMKTVYIENEREKQIKKELLEQQREKDLEYTREYGRILDEQEIRKKNELQGRLDRQKARAKNMEDLALSIERKQEMDDAGRIANERIEMEKRLIEVERKKAEEMSKKRLDTQEFLLQQMQEHDAQKQERQKSKQVQAKILAQDNVEFSRAKNQEIEARKERHVTHMRELQAQIDRRKLVKSEAMSVDEIAMNRGLLKKVDDVLQERRVMVEG